MDICNSPNRRVVSAPPRRKWQGVLFALSPLAILITLLSSGCNTAHPTGAQATNTRYLVTADSTSFFKFGPSQQGGADFSLQKGRQVVMLEKRYGYSRVQTEDGQTGYVPTDDVGPAPFEQKLASIQNRKSGGGMRSKGSGKIPDFDQPNDATLPSVLPGNDGPAPSFRY